MIKSPLVIYSSRLMMLFLIVAHAVSISVIIMVTLNGWIKLLLVLLCIINFVSHWSSQVIRKSPHSVVKIWQRDSKLWCLENPSGKIMLAKLSGEYICGRYLVILNFRVPKQLFIKSVVIPFDAMSKDNYRSLRMRLRFIGSY